MSLGFGISDIASFVQLTWQVVEGAKAACGEHDDLTKEMVTLHTVLSHVESEMRTPHSILGDKRDKRVRGLENHIERCEEHLLRLDSLLRKYNSLSKSEKSAKKLWQKAKFGNHEIVNVKDIRQKVQTYTEAISITLQLFSSGSLGKVERQLNRQTGGLDSIQESVNLVLAKLTAIGTSEGSVMTDYHGDDRTFWKNLRRELVAEGVPSSALRGQERLIKKYIKELGQRGMLDDRNASTTTLPLIRELKIPQNFNATEIGQGSLKSEDEECDDEPSGKNEVSLESVGFATTNELPGSETDESISSEDGNVEESYGSGCIVEGGTDDEYKTKETEAQEDQASSHSPLMKNHVEGEDHKRIPTGVYFRETSPQNTSTPFLQPYLEEVVDADFIPGSHPNVLSSNSIVTCTDSSKATQISKCRRGLQAYFEEVLDADFMSGAHPNVVDSDLPSEFPNPRTSLKRLKISEPDVFHEAGNGYHPPLPQSPSSPGLERDFNWKAKPGQWVFSSRLELLNPKLRIHFYSTIQAKATQRLQTRYDEFLARYNRSIGFGTIHAAPAHFEDSHKRELTFLKEIMKNHGAAGLRELSHSAAFKEEFYSSVCETPMVTRGSPEDATFDVHRIPKDLFSSNWDGSKEPIVFAGNVFDVETFGTYLYHWSQFIWGAESKEAKRAKAFKAEMETFETSFEYMANDLREVYAIGLSSHGSHGSQPETALRGNKIWVQLKERIHSLVTYVESIPYYYHCDELDCRYVRAFHKNVGGEKWIELRERMSAYHRLEGCDGCPTWNTTV